MHIILLARDKMKATGKIAERGSGLINRAKAVKWIH